MLTFEQAKEIAAREIERLTSEPPLRDYEFGQMWFKREEEPFWVFAAASQELQDNGYVPGAVYVLVDKLDGHIWSDEEQERYYESLVADAQLIDSRALAAKIRRSLRPGRHSDSAALLAEDRQK
jgi:hypothetical protein